ncbi:hypothetical protein DB346_11545 [Verrucomicrobia bacterium LW23]|nr:hypothetical protein DB346_11545 [Verrucomicrobia bacterium LW23]
MNAPHCDVSASASIAGSAQTQHFLPEGIATARLPVRRSGGTSPLLPLPGGTSLIAAKAGLIIAVAEDLVFVRYFYNIRVLILQNIMDLHRRFMNG